MLGRARSSSSIGYVCIANQWTGLADPTSEEHPTADRSVEATARSLVKLGQCCVCHVSESHPSTIVKPYSLFYRPQAVVSLVSVHWARGASIDAVLIVPRRNHSSINKYQKPRAGAVSDWSVPHVDRAQERPDDVCNKRGMGLVGSVSSTVPKSCCLPCGTASCSVEVFMVGPIIRGLVCLFGYRSRYTWETPSN